ncbi:SRPBCC family protein [Bradyrhizobium sp. AUGA SZCCT0431]|uniref:SRPBCC family protein n=1 Tax=Bradyrhizobium sp. AUGA SZCCT0431 TaxID=2807674 RepID=UPI001BADAE1C|nr:SRPBCC family protein [Bradyrhizobium sp. AUGA SZCCT0431]MBR1147480.1 SRPBCC family protein [Bradyrhizobium sp. AUGA SZCCT0431]
MSKPEFVYVTYIETTPEKLWQALTSSEFTKRYWWNTSVVSDWKVGSPFSLVMDGTTTDVGEVLEFDPPRRLSYTFHHILSEAARKERPTKVVFTLEPHAKLVKLTLTHEDFEPGSVILDGISKGWPAILSSLKSMLESGTALTIPPSCLGIEGAS